MLVPGLWFVTGLTAGPKQWLKTQNAGNGRIAPRDEGVSIAAGQECLGTAARSGQTIKGASAVRASRIHALLTLQSGFLARSR